MSLTPDRPWAFVVAVGLGLIAIYPWLIYLAIGPRFPARRTE